MATELALLEAALRNEHKQGNFVSPFHEWLVNVLVVGEARPYTLLAQEFVQGCVSLYLKKSGGLER